MKIGIKLILSIVKIPVPMPEFKTFLLLIPLAIYKRYHKPYNHQN